MEIVNSYMDETFASLTRPSSVNIIFGAGWCGRLVLAKARECGMPVEALCDNSPAKVNSELDGVGIISPEDAAKKWRGANFILAMAEAGSLSGAVAQLAGLGVENCFDAQWLRRLLVSSKDMHRRSADAAADLDRLEWITDVQGDFTWSRGENAAIPAGVSAESPGAVWADGADVKRLGVRWDTRKWAYGWIVDHLRRRGKVELICDFGGGDIDAYFPGRLSIYAKSVIVVDQFGKNGVERENIRQLVADMEHRIEGLADNSVDVVVSASAIEHLRRAGQINVFSEINRVLKPGGVFCGTISYVTHLTAGSLAILSKDPMIDLTGSHIGDPIDLSKLLTAATDLLLPKSLVGFPGYAGFSESALLSDPTLVHDTAGSYPGVACRPETDALRLKWFEMGLFLPKSGKDKEDSHGSAPDDQ